MVEKTVGHAVKLKAPYYVRALLMAIPAILIGIQIPTWVVFVPSRKIELQADFRVLYTAGYMVRTGQARSLYNYSVVRGVQARIINNDDAAVPFIHPAFETLIFAPLSLLPYRNAYLVWVCISCALMVVIWRALHSRVDALAKLLAWLPAALLPSFFPLSFAVMQGQDSLLLLLSLVLTYDNIAENEFVAGVCLGLGIFRFQVLLPILLLLLGWRAWRVLLGSFLTSCGLLAISVAISGFNSQVQYFRLLVSLAALPYLELTNRMVNIRGSVTAFGGGVFTVVVLSIVVLVGSALRGFKQSKEQRFLLSIAASALIAYHFFLHDMCILLLPALIALNQSLASGEWKKLGILGASFCLPTIVWFSGAPFYMMMMSTVVLFCALLAAKSPSSRLYLPPLRSSSTDRN